MTRRPRLGIYILLIAASMLSRVGHIWTTGSFGRTPTNYREYVYAGSRFLAHGVITSPLFLEDVSREPASMLPPAYILVVSAMYALFGVESFAATLALQLINAAAISIAVALAYSTARKMFGARAGLLASLIALVNPALFAYTAVIWDTCLFLCGVCLVVRVLLHFSETPDDWWRQLGFGILLGALAHVNPALTAAYPFMVLWYLTREHGWCLRRVARGVTRIVVGWALAVGPWTIRNYVHFGDWQYVRGSFNIVLWIGACPEAHTNPAEVFSVWYPMRNAGEQNKLIEQGEHRYVKEWGAMARRAIREDFGAWLNLCGWRATDYWMGTVFTHASHEAGGWPQRRIRQVVTVFLGLEAVLLLLCYAIVRPIGSDLWWLAGIVTVFSLIYILTHVQVRYRAPTEPLIAVMLAGVASRSIRSLSCGNESFRTRASNT